MITTIIFDWGGVIAVGRYRRPIFELISKEKSTSIEDKYPDFDELISKINQGIMSFKDFLKNLNSRLGLALTEGRVREIFRQAMILDEKVIDIIKDLHSSYNLVLLSDNNEITVNNMKAYRSDMLGLFGKKYFSYELKMLKPDPKLFAFVLEDLKLSTSECIFIDDKQNIIDAAKQCGINGILFSSADQLKEELRKLKIKI
ncbi:MAG TPA: HAD family phosphatase [Candidatus Nanoarchaeia archaeon]|nr:HAD family phosphatase [Candidatus Nanoarchaeia archaeon]